MEGKNEQLLELARNAIKLQLYKERLEVSDKVKKDYSEKKACFVTLTKDGELRGCIGSLWANKELWKEVIENSLNAAFRDPRFLPVSSSELNKIKIEISILSARKQLKYKTPKNLLEKIDRKMGIVLKKGFYSATFLPQVWKQIPSKEIFLEQLSLKAGLDKDSWKDSEIEFYRVESMMEK